MVEPWTDLETTNLKRAIQKAPPHLSERGLARHIHRSRQFRPRTEAALYVKIRVMTAGGTGWWHGKPISHQVQRGTS